MPTTSFIVPVEVSVGDPTRLSHYNSIKTAVLWLKSLVDEIIVDLAARRPASIAGFSAGDIRISSSDDNTSNDWLLCDGRAVSRTTYSDLFVAIGTAYGAGDDSTTFNLPDFRGKSPLCVNTSRIIGTEIGQETVAISVLEMPSHAHSGNTTAAGGHQHLATVSEGGSHSHVGSADSDGNHSHSLPDHGAGFTIGTLNPWTTRTSSLGYTSTSSRSAHSHTATIVQDGNHSHTISVVASIHHRHTATLSSVGRGEGHNNVQPSIVFNAYIKV